MKRLFLIALLAVFSISAYAQSPLGSSKEEIKAFFAGNVSYAVAQEYVTKDGTSALNFTKVRIVGDYTFYFNQEGICTKYTETFDSKDQTKLMWRLDRKFCRMTDSTWQSEDESFQLTLLPPDKGANYITVAYKPVQQQPVPTGTLALN
jgi:hypothetical protein